ncbi:MAG: DUF2279 domain-containing protein [Cyclobacteriaceae bacterium]|nr:DUF2279 domain-containing protein [Cyclobacteriaceae bacterium]
MKKNSTIAVSPKANPRLKWVIGFMVLIYLALVFALAKAWYADQMVESFHFFNDLPEWKQLDKFAHALWAFHICAIATRLLKWGSLDQPIAMGAIIGFLFVSSIEILDGFSAGYGASLFDLAANALGAALFFVQMKIWNRIHIFPKFSFHFTSFAVLRPSLLGDGFFQEILKDYNGQTFWYSWSPAKKWWPSFLSLAVGIGAEGMIYGRDGQNEAHQFSPYRKLLFSLDLNSNYLSSKKGWIRAVAYPFTVVKFPAPAIEISVQGIRFHWLHF